MTAFVELDDIIHLTREMLPAAPDASHKRAWLYAAREFCAKTRFIRDMLHIDSAADQDAYELVPSLAGDDFEVVGVRSCEFARYPLVPTGPEERQYRDDSGDPAYYWFNPPNTLILMPAPSTAATEAIWVSVWLQPKTTTTCLPDTVLRRHEQVIRDGALAWMFDMPKKPWGDKAEATERRNKFVAGMATAGFQADKTHRPTNFRVKKHV